MARTISATYRRVFSVKPYETETVEVSVTDDVDDSQFAEGPARRPAELADLVKDLYAALADVGDRIVLDRLGRAPVKSEDEPAKPPKDWWVAE